MAKKPKRVLIFDADGAIFNTVEPKLHNLAGLLNKRCGVDYQTAYDRYASLAGMKIEPIIETILTENGAKGDVPKLAEEYNALDNKIKPKAFPDAKFALKELKNLGYTLVLSTSAPPVDAIRGALIERKSEIKKMLRFASTNFNEWQVATKGKERPVRLAKAERRLK